VYVQYTNPAGYPPLEHSSRLLAERGWHVLFLGTGAWGADTFRFPPHPNVSVRQLAFCPAGWRQKLHYLAFCAWVVAWVVWWRPRYVYASDYLAAPLALLLSYLPGLRVIYHEHDTPPCAGASRFARLCLAARARLTRRAELSVLPGRERAATFRREVAPGREVLCVWNCPTRDEVVPPRSPRGGEELVLFYHGSIVPPQLPETVLHALARLPAAVRLRVAGYETAGHRGYVDRLRALAGQLGVADRVEWLGSAPTRAQLLGWCATADVGLALFPRESHQPMAGASNKPFDYLACGLALVVSDLPDWKALFVEPGYALACDPEDPDAIAAALRQFLEQPARARALGEAGRQRIRSEWNYETQFTPVLDLLEGRA
jgi:glycosyltransferase involved in cell wall biosynthesis